MTHSIVFWTAHRWGCRCGRSDFHHYREYDTTSAELVRERLRGVTIAITNNNSTAR